MATAKTKPVYAFYLKPGMNRGKCISCRTLFVPGDAIIKVALTGYSGRNVAGFRHASTTICKDNKCEKYTKPA